MAAEALLLKQTNICLLRRSAKNPKKYLSAKAKTKTELYGNQSTRSQSVATLIKQNKNNSIQKNNQLLLCFKNKSQISWSIRKTEIQKSVNQLPQIQKFRNQSMNYLKYRNSAINYLILIQKINTEIEKSVNQLPQIQKFRNHSINYLVLIQKINTEIQKTEIIQSTISHWYRK